MSLLPGSVAMQTPGLGSQLLAAAQDKAPVRKRGRPPTRKLEFFYDDTRSMVKIPKKRGRKPGLKLKPRTILSPLTNSAPSGTLEPEAGSIPQDAAIIPHSAAPQAVAGETSLPDEFTFDSAADPKRYVVDPSDSAFNVLTSHPITTSPYGYRPPLGVCRRASSPASFQEGNRHGYSSMPDGEELKRLGGKNPATWGVEDVVSFIKEADPQALAPHVDAFRKHEIDGDALLLLRSEMMMKYLGLKLGPALKLCYHIEKLKQSR